MACRFECGSSVSVSLTPAQLQCSSTQTITLHATEAIMVNGRNHEPPSLETSAISLKSMSPTSGCKYEAVGFQTVPAALEAPCFICEAPFKRDAARKRVRRRGAEVFMWLLSHEPRLSSSFGFHCSILPLPDEKPFHSRSPGSSFLWPSPFPTPLQRIILTATVAAAEQQGWNIDSVAGKRS